MDTHVRDNLIELRAGNVTGINSTGSMILNAAATANALIHQVSGATKAAFCLSGYPNGDSSVDATIFANTGNSIRFMTNGSAVAVGKWHASGGLSIGDSTDPGSTNLRVVGTVTAIGTIKSTGQPGFLAFNSSSDASQSTGATIDFN